MPSKEPKATGSAGPVKSEVDDWRPIGDSEWGVLRLFGGQLSIRHRHTRGGRTPEQRERERVYDARYRDRNRAERNAQSRAYRARLQAVRRTMEIALLKLLQVHPADTTAALMEAAREAGLIEGGPDEAPNQSG